MTTYPLAMPDTGPASLRFDPKRVDYISPKAGGRLNAVSAGVPLWYGRWELGGSIGARRSEIWQAFVDQLDGPRRYFLGCDHFRPMPLAYLASGMTGLVRSGGGAFDGSATSWSQTIAADDQPLLDLAGLPPGFVVSIGDYVGFRWQTGGEDRRHLVRAQQAAVASAGGAIVGLAIRPAVHTVVPVNAVAHFDKPACLMKLIPDETDLGSKDRRGSLSGVVAGIQDLIE
ncbi:hypothetical protein [Caulobacter vibrioides]|uniref:hypothetical protein n=1 Tax=Caulobacter vibrioides TaxID=155892 RepID=UPI000F742B73|nr:hypothetical protein [Caulobacter vibrioides]